METKKPKLKDHALWLWSHMYEFADGKRYFYEGTVNSSDVAVYFGCLHTQKTYDRINTKSDVLQKILENNSVFNTQLVDRYYEDACAFCYEEI